MILQRTHQQILLSEKEEWYAWISQVAEIQKQYQKLLDQSPSGYQARGTGADGTVIEAELTREELFDIFLKRSLLLGKEIVRKYREEPAFSMDERSLLEGTAGKREKSKIEREGVLIRTTACRGRTKTADVSLELAGVRLEGLRIHERQPGKAVLVMPAYYQRDSTRTELFAVHPAVEGAVLDEYRAMQESGETGREGFFALPDTGIVIRPWKETRQGTEEGIRGYEAAIGEAIEIRGIRVRPDASGGRRIVWPAEAIWKNGQKVWHSLVIPRPDCRIPEMVMAQANADGIGADWGGRGREGWEGRKHSGGMKKRRTEEREMNTEPTM